MKEWFVRGLRTGFVAGISVLIVFSFCIAAAASAAHDPLIEVLIRKGVLTEKEARNIEREAADIEKERRQEVLQEVKKEKQAMLPKPLRGLKFRMLSYLDYSIGNNAEPGDKQSNYNRFSIKRGYFRVDKKITPWLGAHLTYDVHQDDQGDWKTRLKYLYAEFKPGDMLFFTGMKAEAGLGHIPWLDFEEHINPYRCQGTMAIERAGTFNSADLGLSIRGDFGGKLDDARSSVGNHHYDGKWGSWHVGVYNGSGYHSKEHNGNKIVDGRITVRPLPDMLPGLQLSYFGLGGEGNNKTPYGNYPDYQVHLGMLSFQNPRVILTTQYFTTHGNKDGAWYDSKGDALWTQGTSVFANFKPPVYGFFPSFDRKLNLFFRYDWVDRDKNDKIAHDTSYNMYIIGGAWEVFKGNYLLVDYEWTDYGKAFGSKKSAMPVPGNNMGDEDKFQMVYQLKF